VTLDPFLRRTTVSSGKRVLVGDVELWCHDTGGDGEVVLLLGGFTAGHFVFDFVREYLPGYRLVTWEPRGLGLSDCPDPTATEYSVDVWVADLRGLLSELGIEKAHVWADGFGGFIAAGLAAAHPDVVASLVTSTEVWAGFEDRSKNWEIYSTIVRNLGVAGRGARLLANWMDVETVPWFVQWESRNIEEVLHPETVAATVGYCLLTADVRDDLPRVGAPTLVILGGSTGAGDDAAVTYMRETMDSLAVVAIPEAHASYGVVTHPEQFAVTARDFFETHRMAH
jgi:Predicted hydrolases or acyltransferases (alpha/beta hydrolase superfamily)